MLAEFDARICNIEFALTEPRIRRNSAKKMIGMYCVMFSKAFFFVFAELFYMYIYIYIYIPGVRTAPRGSVGPLPELPRFRGDQ